MWEIDYSEEYQSWFLNLDGAGKEAVFQRVLLLQEFGPNLGRPYADTLKGSSKISNLKELRTQTQNQVLRVVYYFDPLRKAYLLIGGDKKGRNQDKFYKDLISIAESIITQHEREDLK